jgi:hypothetical protein
MSAAEVVRDFSLLYHQKSFSGISKDMLGPLIRVLLLNNSSGRPVQAE